jgi:soluble lytic murein transglycosylase-like protein
MAAKLLSRAETGALIENCVQKHKLEPAFVKSIMAAEPAFQTDAVSSKRAPGLMQVMPANDRNRTWRRELRTWRRLSGVTGKPPATG